MKFIRNAQRSKVKDRFFDVLSKAALIAISALVCLWMVSGAHASQASITDIKTQSQEDGSYAIDFSLSQKISPEAVSVEFDRNFIQISLKGVSAYPARTENINQAALEKVFTYQYQPDLSRARVLLKTSAATIKSKTSWEITKTGVRIIVKGQGTAAAADIASDTLKNKASASAATTAATPSSSTSDSEEERIVQEILNESKPTGKTLSLATLSPSTKSPVTASSTPAVTSPAAAAALEEQPLFGAKTGTESVLKSKEDSAPTRILASLLLVIGIIGASAVAYRRFALGKGITFQKQAKVIDIISTQTLGPKRSVALIKVIDQYMVVGMAGDSMNLLANLGSDVKIEKFLDQNGGPGSSFTDTFEGALAGVTAAGKTDTAGSPLSHKETVSLGVRSSIKKRLESFKPL